MQRAHGPNGTWAPNDPLGNRAEAIMQGYETIQNLLDSNRVTGVSHRIHVIEFGTTARLRPDLTIPITHDPAALPGRVGAVKSRIRSGLLGASLGYTDTKAAFEEAEKLIATLGTIPKERVHVILITDGKPYVEDQAGQPLATGLGSPYQNEMDNLLRGMTQHATLDVIGITGNRLDAYWPTWGPYWERVSEHHAVSGERGTEISFQVDRILRERLGLPTQTLAGNPYFCPPYLRSVTFTVFKNQRGGMAQIKDALGRLVTPGMPGVTYVNEVTYDRVTVEEPAPGLWELDRQASKVTVDMLYKQVDRLEPKGSLNTQIPVQFKYKVLSDRQQPFQPLPNYPVQAMLQVTDPAGQQTDVPLTHQGQGVFAADKPFQFAAYGAAHLRMTGTTVLPDGSTVTVFLVDEPLTVTNKTLINLSSGATLPGLIPLRFGRRVVAPEIVPLRYPAGPAVPPSAFAARPEDLLEFRLVRRDGTALSGWQRMTAAGGSFKAEVPVRAPLLSRDWLRRHDEAFAEVRVNEAALRPDFAIGELKRDGPDPAFAREASLPALRDNPLALPVVLGEWIVTFVLILAFGVLALALVAHFGYRYLRRLCYYVGDTWLWRQRVTLVVQPPFQDEITKPLTNDYRFGWKGRSVKIMVGGEERPDWKPSWLKAKRLFRPWAGEVVVKVKYPIRTGKKETRRSVVLTASSNGQDGLGTPLAGVPAPVQALVRVRRRGKGSMARAL